MRAATLGTNIARDTRQVTDGPAPRRLATHREAGQPRRGALAVLAAAQLVLALDYSIVNVALPTIGQSIGFSTDATQWVISAYALTFAGFLLLGGRAADLLGRRRMFMGAAALFGVASAVGGLAASPAMLIGSRMLQGLAGAFLFPATLSLVTTVFPEGSSRNRAVSVWGASGASGLAVGVLLGGILTSTLGWRAIFYVNVPVIALLLAFAARLLPAGRPERLLDRGFDLPGAVIATTGSTLLVLALIQASQLGWTSAGTLVPGLVGLLLLATFLLIELRSAAPLMPIALLRRRPLWGGLIVTGSFMASFGMQFFFLTLYLERALGEAPITAGLSFLPLAVANVAGNRVGGRLTTRLGVRWVLSAGLAIGGVGMLLYILLGPTSSLPLLIVAELIAGFGQGIGFTTAYLAVGTGVPRARQGVASGMASTAQYIGGSVGLALLVDLLTARLGGIGGLTTGAVDPATLVASLHWVFAAQAALAFVAALVAAVVIRMPRVDVLQVVGSGGCGGLQPSDARTQTAEREEAAVA